MGLLILRVVAGFMLLSVAYMMVGPGDVATMLLRYLALVIAALLLVGFGTPLAAVGEAAIQVVIMIVDRRYSTLAVIAIALGVALAMLGPGAWSMDARVFGRKRIV